MPVKPCPRCKQPLEIPVPQPPKVQCPNCKAVLKLAAPVAVAAGAIAAGAKTNPGVGAATHVMSGAPPTQEAPSPFSMDDEDGAPMRRRRRSSMGGIIVPIVVLLLIGGVVVALLLLRKKEEPAPVVVKNTVPTPAFIPAPPVEKDVGDPIDQPRINKAIEKGVVHLKKQIMDRVRLYHRSELADVAKANAHLGALGLAGLTLLECGHPPDDVAVQVAAQEIRDQVPNLHATYTIAIAILFLDRLHNNLNVPDGPRLNEENRITLQKKDSDRDLIRLLAKRLMAGQGTEGYWGYGERGDNKVTPADEERALQEAKQGRATGKKLYYQNLSNSQFAVLALWASRRHGVPVQPAIKAAGKAARAKQIHANATDKPDKKAMDGTWMYDLNLPMKHSSACAGLILLAVERGILEEGTIRSGGKAHDPKLDRSILEDPAVKAAMNFLGKFLKSPSVLTQEQKDERIIAAKRNKQYWEAYEMWDEDKEKAPLPKAVAWGDPDIAYGGTIFGAKGWGDLYFLWSIERVGMMYDVNRIQPGKGGKDWYAWGSKIICDNQKDNGDWEDRFPGVPDTCFALLFLKRANIAKDLTDKLREVLGWSAAQAPPPPGQTPAKKKD